VSAPQLNTDEEFQKAVLENKSAGEKNEGLENKPKV
jgi:hypothetical protein